MFFLKELPTRQMIEAYAPVHGADASKVEAALLLMRRASLLIRRLETYFSRHDLSQLRFLILMVIDREPARNSLTVGEITERLDVAGPIVTRTLKTMIDDGLVEIDQDIKDRRTRHVSLSSLGKERLAAVLPGYFELIADEMALR